MKALQKMYKETQIKLKNFQKLSKCRNMDSPNNLDSICHINLNLFMEYFKKEIKNKLDYNIKYDYYLITFIYNYLASLKSYLNRKTRYIEQNVPKDYKQKILEILRKYWKSGRKTTIIDKLIIIRDRLEHEDLTSGTSLKIIYYEDHIVQKLMIDKVEIIGAFTDSYNLIKEMNNEIERFIANQLNKLDLRHCILFMNAFYKHYKNKHYSLLYPEPTDDEIKKYDELIENLSRQN